jgi:hypothetical protein
VAEQVESTEADYRAAVDLLGGRLALEDGLYGLLAELALLDAFRAGQIVRRQPFTGRRVAHLRCGHRARDGGDRGDTARDQRYAE